MLSSDESLCLTSFWKINTTVLYEISTNLFSWQMNQYGNFNGTSHQINTISPEEVPKPNNITCIHSSNIFLSSPYYWRKITLALAAAKALMLIITVLSCNLCNTWQSYFSKKLSSSATLVPNRSVCNTGKKKENDKNLHLPTIPLHLPHFPSGVTILLLIEGPLKFTSLEFHVLHGHLSSIWKTSKPSLQNLHFVLRLT